MTPMFKPLISISWKRFCHKFKFSENHTSLLYVHYLHTPCRPTPENNYFEKTKSCRSVLHFVHSFANGHSVIESQKQLTSEVAIEVQNILKKYKDSPTRKIELALIQCSLTLTEDLILNVLKRNRSDWKLALIFFKWVSSRGQDFLGSCVYNEILDILGKMRRFEEMTQVLGEMSRKEQLVNEDTYRILVNRYAAAHKVEEAINIFNNRRDLGLEIDLVAFQKLLMYLCRHKHVEVAETLLYSKGNDFDLDIKIMNIILNGWCVLGNVHEAKRFWKDIIGSKCMPDLFTYGIFIKALTQKGKLGTARKLYEELWENQLKPDVVICNCMIDALCFKKKVPQALQVFKEMSERGCLPNVVTYNSLIKHLCKIRRMEKVYELLDEMEEKKGSCMPNDITFNYLLKALKKPDELPEVLERMKRNGCEINGDTYILILKLYLDWDCEDKARDTWNEMERHGLGPDRRSYTIMIHWFYDKGRIDDALRYFKEMTSKGIVPEPRTGTLVSAINMKLKENAEHGKEEPIDDAKRLRLLLEKRKKIRATQ